MLGNHGRSITKAIFTPVARVLVAAHITPNMVTIAGTVVNNRSCCYDLSFWLPLARRPRSRCRPFLRLD